MNYDDREIKRGDYIIPYDVLFKYDFCALQTAPIRSSRLCIHTWQFIENCNFFCHYMALLEQNKFSSTISKVSLYHIYSISKFYRTHKSKHPSHPLPFVLTSIEIIFVRYCWDLKPESCLLETTDEDSLEWRKKWIAQHCVRDRDKKLYV